MPDQQDDQFIQRRLLLASVLSALALTAYVYVSGPSRTEPPRTPPDEQVAGEAPTPEAEPSSSAADADQAAEPSMAPAKDAPAKEEPATAVKKAAEQEQEFVIETDTYAITFTNRGGVVKRWVLKGYNDAKGKQLNLVHSGGAEKNGYAFALAAPGGEPLSALNQALFAVTRAPAAQGAPSVTFEYADETRSARKSFQFQQDGYLFDLESEVTENGELRSHLLTWNSAFGDTAKEQDSQYSTTFYYDPVAHSLERNEAADAEESRIVNTGSFTFAGMDDLFFTAAFLPQEPETPLRLETSAVKIVTIEGGDEETFAALGIGADQKNRFRVFLGPKDVDVLASVRPELREIVDFGFAAFVAEPIFWMLRWTHDHVVANYGWGIIVVTVFINFALFPLKWKSMKSMKKMQSLQPLVKQINEKYKGVSMRDPKKAQQNEEMMALYKKHGVNPMGGCLPMLLQLPFFIGFYNVLTVAIELRHASWLWVPDLSAPEDLAVRVLPLAMVGTQFWQQSMTPTPSTDPAQTRLMKFMPLMFGFIFYGFSSGLVLFWLTSNVVGVAQQFLLNRFSSEEEVIEKPRGRRKKKTTGKSRR